MYRCDINNFGEGTAALPPSCLISVNRSSGAVQSLYYAVPLVGVADPITLYISRELRTTASPSNNALAFFTSPSTDRGASKCMCVCVCVSVCFGDFAGD